METIHHNVLMMCFLGTSMLCPSEIVTSSVHLYLGSNTKLPCAWSELSARPRSHHRLSELACKSLWFQSLQDSTSSSSSCPLRLFGSPFGMCGRAKGDTDGRALEVDLRDVNLFAGRRCTRKQLSKIPKGSPRR